ncbi:MAG: polyprenyl synthetase family protein [Desulfobacterales bacterium]|nr:polyprenyl synthetase family protein [Desulfobacterales bacterium]
MFELNLYLQKKIDQINHALDKTLANESNSGRLIEAMKYSLMAGGKRIRPILCLSAVEAVGGKPEDAIPAACALEMIHTYSLIHDDLPAMDNDNLRRGKPTCHVAFDEATAILAGDALLTLAFQILSSIDCKNKNHALKWLRVTHTIAQTAGYKGLIEGQMRDILSEDVSLGLDDLKQVHTLKTGALINASVCSGAIIGNGTDKQIEQLGIYGENIGLAFQVIDDILNVVGNPTLMGKAAGTDAVRKKSTYPALMGIGESKSFAEKLIHNALHALDYFDNKSDPLRAIASYIIERKM